MDCHDAVEVGEALASLEAGRLVEGVRALAVAVREMDWYEVPLPRAEQLPAFLAAADPEAAQDLLYALEAHGFFVPPATRDDLWRWGGAVVACVGGTRLALQLGLQVRCADAPVAALAAVLAAVDLVADRPWAPTGLNTFLDSILDGAGPLHEAAVAELGARSNQAAWAAVANPALSRAAPRSSQSVR